MEQIADLYTPSEIQFAINLLREQPDANPIALGFYGYHRTGCPSSISRNSLITLVSRLAAQYPKWYWRQPAKELVR